ncbi:MAG: hypothetical protein AAB923_00780, partial [Patescibacteria group bacterium]
MIEPAPLTMPTHAPTPSSPNSLWAKVIPRTNKSFAVICAAFLVLDAVIVAFNTSLAPFLIPMAVVMLVFYGFYRFENTVLKKRFSASTSSLDKYILILVVIRNLVFLMNVIPVIQLLGFMALAGFISPILYLAQTSWTIGHIDVFDGFGPLSVFTLAPWL